MKPLITVLLALVVAVSAHAQPNVRPFSDDADLSEFPARWQEIMDLFDVPGAAVVAVKDGQIYATTFGQRSPEGDPVTPETMFYIASITKTYLATALIDLDARGKLSLDDPVRRYLPWFELADEQATQTITIRDLLSHKAGLNYGPIVLLDAYTGEITAERYRHWLKNVTPNPAIQYSNVNYTLLGYVVEAVTGNDWRDHLDNALFTPAGMPRTTGYASELYGDNDAAFPMERDRDDWKAIAQRKTDRTMHAAGGLGTCAADAGRYLLMHMNGGRLDGEQVIDPEVVRAMQSIALLYTNPRGTIRIMNGRALGWEIGKFVDTPLLAHGGGYAGSRAWFGVLPEENVAVAILINGGGSASAWGDIVAVDLLERMSGRTAPWSPYENYTARMKQMRSERIENEEANDERPARIAHDSLSRPIGQYVGAFRNEHWGTLHVDRDDRGLHFRLGDAALEIAGSDETDAVRIAGWFDPPAVVEFQVGDDGRINTITMTEAEYGVFDFVR